MTNRERMEAGLIYDPGEPALMNEQFDCMAAMAAYNATRPDEQEKRRQLLPQMLADVGPDSYIEAPFYANWGGKHVHVGRQFYANFHLTVVDDGEVFIGDRVMIGPNVTIATAAHPIDPSLRARALQYNLPVHIGSDVWIGAGAIVLPGVTIGDGSVIGADSIIGAGALVTEGTVVPPGSLVLGVPGKVVRPVTEEQRQLIRWDAQHYRELAQEHKKEE